MMILFLLLAVALVAAAVMGFSQSYDRPFDASLQLSDAGAAVTSDGYAQVASATAQIDTLNGSTLRSGDPVPRYEADLVLDVSAIDVASADETYVLRVMGSNSATFASGVVCLATVELGRAAAMGAATIAKTTGRHIQAFENSGYTTAAGSIVNLQYLRLHVDVGGTTPSITFTAFLAPRQ
jgi:hypothetical protein